MYIRTRLALWFMLILAIVLVTFSVSIYNLTHDSLLAQAKQDVRNLAGVLVAAVQPGLADAPPAIANLDAFTAPDISLQVRDAAGEVRASAGYLGAQSIPQWRDTIKTGQVEEVRVGAQPFYVYDRPVYTGAT